MSEGGRARGSSQLGAKFVKDTGKGGRGRGLGWRVKANGGKGDEWSERGGGVQGRRDAKSGRRALRGRYGESLNGGRSGTY